MGDYANYSTLANAIYTGPTELDSESHQLLPHYHHLSWGDPGCHQGWWEMGAASNGGSGVIGWTHRVRCNGHEWQRSSEHARVVELLGVVASVMFSTGALRKTSYIELLRIY